MVDFGTCMACTTDLLGGAMVSGRTAIAQAIVRRLITPRGRLIGYPNYGFDLVRFLNDDIDAAGLARIRAGVEAECKKDERVLDCSAIVTLSVVGVMLVDITLTDAEGPFQLVLAVSEVTVSILTRT